DTGPLLGFKDECNLCTEPVPVGVVMRPNCGTPFTQMACAIALLFPPSTAWSSPCIDVLLATHAISSSRFNDIADRLIATGSLNAVTHRRASILPIAADLAPYQAIFVFHNDTLRDPEVGFDNAVRLG